MEKDAMHGWLRKLWCMRLESDLHSAGLNVGRGLDEQLAQTAHVQSRRALVVQLRHDLQRAHLAGGNVQQLGVVLQLKIVVQLKKKKESQTNEQKRDREQSAPLNQLQPCTRSLARTP
jgi:hypothetical protein